MITGKRFIRCSICILLALVLGMCGGKGEDPQSEARYAEFERKIVDLYCDLHPLVSSRLGLYRADSLLFTFSERELVEAAHRLNGLLDDLDGFDLSALAPHRIDNLELLANWIKGELFALETVRNHRRNPLLYCWMIEEALCGPCTRIDAPYDGERAAYEKRIARIPALCAHARDHLTDPAQPHVRLSIDLLDRLLTLFAEIEARASRRYGSPIGPIDEVRSAVEEFLDYIEYDLSQYAFGRLILGSENLSKILIYDELLDIDVNKMVQEAERAIRKLESQALSLEKSLESIAVPGEDMLCTGMPIDSCIKELISEIDTRSYEGKLIERIEEERIEIVFNGCRDASGELPANPYLTIPPPDEPFSFAVFTPPFSGRDAATSLYMPRNLPDDTDTLLYQLLSASAIVRSIGFERIERGDTLRTIVGGQTFRIAWRIHNLMDCIETFPEKRLLLQSIFMREKIHALARMIVVFKLHAGTFTSESAIEYLSTTAGVSMRRAGYEVTLAASSPSLAYSGLCILMLEEMVKKAGLARGRKKPHRFVRQLLLDNLDLPLPMIQNRIPGK
ncbi:MAG: hypothetical protein JSV33_01475 [bacterium]|nr:MAG: hypothetical protein JSV33_01475 [bacterium]